MTKDVSAARAVVFMGAAQACRLVVTFLTAPILGRLLQPADFGLIATSAPIIGFVTMIQNLGLTQAIIQRKTITKGQTNTLFWLSLFLSLTLAAGLAVLAPVLARYFQEPRLTAVIWVAAMLTVVSVIAEQPMALLTRGLRFKLLAAIDILGIVIGAALGVAVAWYTRSYWALLVPLACARVLNLIVSAHAARWLPGRPVWDEAARQMLGFGAGLSTFNVLNFLARSADNLMIAKAHGAVALGFYDRAYKLMLLPLTQATWPLSRIMTPILSRLQDEPEEYRHTYTGGVSLLMLAVQPGVLCAVMFSDATVALLLGSKWAEAAPIFAWLGFAGLHQLFTSTMGWLFISQGRMRDLSIVGLVGSTSTIASFAVGLPWGPLGVAISYVVSDYVLRLPFTWYMTGRAGFIRVGDIYRIVGPHACSLLVSAAALAPIKAALHTPSPVELCGALLLTYAVNTAVLMLFKSKRRLIIDALKVARQGVGLRRTP
ncbi:lipopolysaccharide biosynthesis protein [Microvirga zambiensis]|uniref:lipopolysaccharide biosynthesis protein n=1 Tax=Microvirga zambiensis TaxID=1402137 RepID=UPI00191DDF1A|nr:lipopolysaccharide biosynthesis protein [Microvirga zambiensis]